MTDTNAQRIAALRALPVSALTVTDTLADAVTKLLHKYLLALLQAEAECRVDKKQDAALRMLESVRTLIVLVGMLESQLPDKHAKKLHKRLSKLKDKLRDLYTLDVMMRQLLVYGEGVDHRMTIAGLVAYLDARRLVVRQSLWDYFEHKKYIWLLDTLQAIVIAPQDLLPPEDESLAPRELRHVLPVIINQQLAIVRAFETVLTDDEHHSPEVYKRFLEQVHTYHLLLCSFEPILGGTIANYLDSVSLLRRALERIAESTHTLNHLIHLPRLSLDASQVVALKNYRRYLSAQREMDISKLPDTWQTFNLRRTQEKLSQALLALR